MKHGKPAPTGLFEEVDTRLQIILGDRWYRCQDMWRDQPPTHHCDSGRECIAEIVDGKLTGKYRIGLQYKYTKEGLYEESQSCGMGFMFYLKWAEEYYGEPIKLIEDKPPYIVDMTTKECTCPDYQQRGIACKHYMALIYGFCLMKYSIDYETGLVTFKEYEDECE